jgi:hypothetical protein
MFILSGIQENGFLTARSGNTENDEQQLRPGLWKMVNERYPGSMISKSDFSPLAKANLA